MPHEAIGKNVNDIKRAGRSYGNRVCGRACYARIKIPF